MTNEEGHGTDDTNPKHRGGGGGGGGGIKGWYSSFSPIYMSGILVLHYVWWSHHN